MVKARNRGEATFRKSENVADRVFAWLLGKPISALVSSVGVKNIGFIENRNNLFKIFF